VICITIIIVLDDGDLIKDWLNHPFILWICGNLRFDQFRVSSYNVSSFSSSFESKGKSVGPLPVQAWTTFVDFTLESISATF
jgi:hypothetical protein